MFLTLKKFLNKFCRGKNLIWQILNINQANEFKHSQDEDRWQVIGKVKEVLFVVYTERGDITRIISARKADSQERKIYNDGTESY